MEAGLLPHAGALIAALAAATAAVPASRRHPGWPTALLTLAVGALWAATGALTLALITEDTSLSSVVSQTRPGTSVARRITGLWSGSEGSLLLFASILSTGLLVGHRRAPRWQQAGTAIIVSGLGAAVGWGANPFQRLDLAPAGGTGMAPILEHGAMLIHPPLLYLGMALALTPALVGDDQLARRLCLGAVSVLTLALGIGASWAYVELGWGGWWAWDPIENVGLIVWLLLVGALHSWALDRRRPPTSFLLSPMVLCALCWPAVAAGTALTRTSLRTSVHAFANAAELSAWLWPLVAISAVGAVLRIADDRGQAERASDGSENGRSSIGFGSWAINTPQALLTLAAVIIAAGTYRPFIEGDTTAGWFYSRSLFPLAVTGAVLAGVLPLQRSAPPRRLLAWPIATGAVGAIASAASGWTAPAQLTLAAALAAGLGLVLVDASGLGGQRPPEAPRRPINRLGRICGHLGILLVLFAALAGTAGTDETARLNPGEWLDIDGRRFELTDLEIEEGARPVVTASVSMTTGEDSPNPTVVQPSVTFYPQRRLRLPEVAVHSRPWLDVLVILRDVDPSDGALLTIRLRPYTQILWWGVGLIALSGLAAAAGSSGLLSRREAKSDPASL